MSLPPPRPRRCIHHRPTSKSILFCGVFIHLPSVHMLSGLSISYISLIFSRKREPSLDAAERLAVALDMTLDKFLEGLRGHRRNSSAWKVLDAQRRYKVAMRKRGYQAYVDAPV